jgi:hypothetical protein
LDASNQVNAMQKSIKSIGAAAIAIMAAIAVTGPAGSGAGELADPLAALDPCPLPLPMQAYEAAALWAEGWQRDAIHTPSGLVLRTRVPLPPQVDTGFGCPITRTAS